MGATRIKTIVHIETEMKLSTSNATSAYLSEHNAIIHSAYRILKKIIDRNGSCKVRQLTEACLRIPNIKKFLTEGEGSLTVKKIDFFIYTAALRGAFPGFILRKNTFQASNDETKTEKVRDNVKMSVIAFSEYLGMNKKFYLKKETNSNATPSKCKKTLSRKCR